MILARNLLGTLRNGELALAAKDIAAETGLEHRPVADGQRVAGIRQVIEQRLGQQLAATVRGGWVS